VWVGLLVKLGVPTERTPCGSPPVHVHVTVEPATIVSTAGFIVPL
jgi:hypothetical protein